MRATKVKFPNGTVYNVPGLLLVGGELEQFEKDTLADQSEFGFLRLMIKYLRAKLSLCHTESEVDEALSDITLNDVNDDAKPFARAIVYALTGKRIPKPEVIPDEFA